MIKEITALAVTKNVGIYFTHSQNNTIKDALPTTKPSKTATSRSNINWHQCINRTDVKNKAIK